MSINKTILGEIVKHAKIKWDKISEKEANELIEKISNPEDARRTITNDSDIKAVNGIARIVRLDDNEISLVIDDIDNKLKIRSELARKIQDAIRTR